MAKNGRCGRLYSFRIDIPHHSDNVAMLASTVSSKMLQRMAKVEGFRFEETLTGFKWLGNRAKELAAQGLLVAFAYEEAIGIRLRIVRCVILCMHIPIGYMVGDIVYDKDGISALAVIAELVAKLYRGGTTLRLQLEKLYETYAGGGGSVFVTATYITKPTATVTTRQTMATSFVTSQTSFDACLSVFGPCRYASVKSAPSAFAKPN